MAKSCVNPNDSSAKRLESIYGDQQYKLMKEYGMAGVPFDVKSAFSGKVLSSSLYKDILMHPSLKHLNKDDKAAKAFELYLEVYSDEFIEKYGDWINEPGKFEGFGSRYTDTGEPSAKMLFKLQPKDTKQDEARDKVLEFQESTLKDLEDKVVKMERKANNTEDEDEAQRLRNLITTLRRSIEGKTQLEVGVRSYLQFLRDTQINKFLDQIETAKLNPEDGISKFMLNTLFDFIELHKPNIQRLHTALSSSKELYSVYKSDLEPLLDELEKSMTTIESFANSQLEDSVVDTTQEAYGDKYSKQDILGWFKSSIKKDINGLFRWFGISANAKDPIIRMVVELVRRIHYNIARVVNPAIDNLIDLQVKLNKAGFKDMSIFNEKYKGKKTGFLISEYKWGEFYAAREELEEELVKIYEVESYDQVLRINAELSEEDRTEDKRYKKFKKMHEDFRAKYYTDGKKTPPKNEQFEKLMQNKAFADYYNALFDVHQKAKSRLPSSYRNGIHKYMLPQIRNDYLEAVKTGGLKKGFKVAKRKAGEIIKKTEEDLEFGDIKRDKNGKVLKVVPIHYAQRLENQEEISDDITSMYHGYYTMAENFRQTSDSIDEIELIYRAMGKREIKTPKSMELVQDIIDTQLYGQKLQDTTVTIKGTEYNLSKLLNSALVKYPSSVNMFMNIPVTMSGFLKSRIDTQGENLAGKFTTFGSARQATIEFTKQVPHVMAELANKKKTNKLDLLLRFNQVDDIIYKQYRKLNMDTWAARMANSDLAYVSMMPTGYASVATLALSIYYNYRLVDGEFITENEFNRKYKNTNKKWSNYKGQSLYDAYTVKDGKFEVKKEYRKFISDEFEYKISKKVNNLSNRLEGKLSSLDKGGIHRTALGRAVMLHRGWIPQLAGARFKAKGYDFALDEENEGFYRTVGRLAGNMLELTDGTVRLKISKWNELEEFEKHNLLRFISDITALLAITVLARVLNDIADDDDEDRWFNEYLAYQINRLLLEQKAMVPIPGIGGGAQELFNILKSPAAAINQWEKISGIGSLLIHGSDEIQSGAYKDKTKLTRFFIQQSWLKNLYEIQYPKAKNTYLKSQIFN